MSEGRNPALNPRLPPHPSPPKTSPLPRGRGVGGEAIRWPETCSRSLADESQNCQSFFRATTLPRFTNIFAQILLSIHRIVPFLNQNGVYFTKPHHSMALAATALVASTMSWATMNSLVPWKLPISVPGPNQMAG